MIYKDIPNYPNYRISEGGVVESCWISSGPGSRAGTEWRKVATKVDAKGYTQVGLSNGKPKTWRVHTLMGNIFLEKPISDKRLCIRHLDGNPSNNHIDNLAWGTYADNERDKIANGTYYLGRSRKLTDEQVIEIREKYKNKINSRPELVKIYNVAYSVILGVTNNKTYVNL